ncbi:substrate-binding domain-containing protein [Tsukamurella sp. 1534]|uniref:substrate-binding domain-containing protein n=1 Tax=Tsukamurella sp. 1534 TaxID=1151061 RepID=UPI00030CE003|nr:substrate-binding domain-containing protein [Tsukamurella sp. 1534]
MEPLRIGLAIPLRGPAGLFGPSCEKVAELAVMQLNARDGILGRPVELEVLDAGVSAERFHSDTLGAVSAGRVHAVVGWHISSLRQRIAPSLAAVGVPYVYTSLHEGSEREAVLCPGETPELQVAPRMRWLRAERGIRRWAVVGSEYIWPRRTARTVRAYAAATGLDIVDEAFVSYGCRDFRGVIDRLRRSTAQGVMMLLVGRDAVLFNRQFAAAGLQEKLVRFTPLMEENMLMASGAECTHDLFVAAAYFNSLSTAAAMDFTGSYADTFGPDAPALNNAAESCYEGILALAAASNAAQSLEARTILSALESGELGYDGPRGHVELRSGAAVQQVHLARAADYEFEVLTAVGGPDAG